MVCGAKTDVSQVHDNLTRSYLQIKMWFFSSLLGSGALSSKLLLVRIVENNKIDAYFRAG